MGKPNPTFEKRLREQKKREKRAEKAQRKREREENKKLGIVEEVDVESLDPRNDFADEDES